MKPDFFETDHACIFWWLNNFVGKYIDELFGVPIRIDTVYAVPRPFFFYLTVTVFHARSGYS